MRAHVRHLAGEVAVYGGGQIALRLLSLVTLPIFTRIFSLHDYGIIETIATLMSVLTVLATLSLTTSGQRSHFDYQAGQRRERRAVLSTTFWTLLAWSAALALALILSSDSLASVLFGDARYGPLLALAVASVPLGVLTNWYQEILRLRHQPSRYNLLMLFRAGVSVGVAVYLVAVLGEGLVGYYSAWLLAALLALGLGYGLARDAIGLSFDRRELRVMLAYGLPLVPVVAAHWTLQLADRFFLLRYVPLSELGLYGLGVRLANLLLLVVAPLSLAWSPYYLELHSRDPSEERRAQARALSYAALILCFGALCLSLFARELLLVFTTPSFVGASGVVGLVALSNVFIGLNAMLASGIALSRQTGYFARYAFATIALDLGLNAVLIPLWGIVGAALATVLTYGSQACLYYRRAQRLQPAPYDRRGVLVILSTTVLLGALGTLVSAEPLWLGIAVKALLLLAYPMLLWLLGGLDPGALAYLWAWVRGHLPKAGEGR